MTTLLEGGKHTAGPWKYVPWHIEEASSAVRAPEGWLICTTSSDANARLIAAPDLLAALQAIVEFEASPDFSVWAKRIDAARIAIAKATP